MEDRLNREFDLDERFRRQREAYAAYLASLTCHQQNVCSEITQLTYNPALSQESPVWSKDDDVNLAQLFASNHELNEFTEEVIRLLKLKATCHDQNGPHAEGFRWELVDLGDPLGQLPQSHHGDSVELMPINV